MEVEAKEIKADTRFYVLETDKILTREQKQDMRDFFYLKIPTKLPILVLDRGFKLSLIDEEKNTRI